MATDVAFTYNHADRLTVLELNNDSSKLLTASIDHRVAIYEVDRLTSERKQLDVFTAHDAEIRDAKWFHTSTGTNFVTIGNDLLMKIWTQDVYQAPMSGRRFKKIGFIKSEQLVPFVSVDVKTVGDSTYIVVIDRQGLLSLYEPTNPDEFTEWTPIDQFYVHSPTPGRGDHTSFRVQFDPNPFPLPYLNSLSDDQDQLSIAVAAMNELKLYRSVTDPGVISAHESSLQASTIGRGASHRLVLFEVLKLQPYSNQTQSTSSTLLRDVAMSPGNFRGTDTIAVACINGTVGIFEISLEPKTSSISPDSPTQSRHPHRPTAQSHQSNLTSALNPMTPVSNATQQVQWRQNPPFSYGHHVTPISTLQHAHVDAWSVKWDPGGQTLLSSGSDGTVKIWKRGMSTHGPGEFELFAEQAGEDDNGDSEESDDAKADT